MTKSERRKNAYIAEMLDSLAEDMILTAAVVKANRSTSPDRPHLVRLSSSVEDMATCLINELSNSDEAMAHANELIAMSDAIDQWADRPTDKTGSDGRAAKLVEKAKSVQEWAERLRA